MKKLISSFGLVSIILFTGCFSTSGQVGIEYTKVSQNEMPSWYLNPKTKDGLYLYGIGEGENLEEAIKSALTNISSNLSTTISSTSRLKKESILKYREYVSKEVSEETISKTEELVFRNHEVSNSFKQRFNKIIVEVKVDKNTLFNDLSKELQTLNTNYDLIINKTKDKLTLFNKIKDLQLSYISFMNKANILSSFNYGIEDKYWNVLDNISKQKEDLKNKISFSISKQNISEVVVLKVEEYLNNEGFKVTNQGEYNILVSSVLNHKQPYGMFITNSNLSLQVIKDSSTIFSKEFILEGYSSNSIEDSISNAYNSLEVSIF